LRAVRGLTGYYRQAMRSKIGVKGSLPPLVGCGATPHGFHLLIFYSFTLLQHTHRRAFYLQRGDEALHEGGEPLYVGRDGREGCACLGGEYLVGQEGV